MEPFVGEAGEGECGDEFSSPGGGAGTAVGIGGDGCLPACGGEEGRSDGLTDGGSVGGAVDD